MNNYLVGEEKTFTSIKIRSFGKVLIFYNNFKLFMRSKVVF